MKSKHYHIFQIIHEENNQYNFIISRLNNAYPFHYEEYIYSGDTK